MASHSRRTSSFFFATTSVASHAGTCFVADSSIRRSRAEPSRPTAPRAVSARGGIDVVSLRSPETFAGAEGGSARRRKSMMLPAPGTAALLLTLRAPRGGRAARPPQTSTHASRAVDCDHSPRRRAKNNKLRKAASFIDVVPRRGFTTHRAPPGAARVASVETGRDGRVLPVCWMPRVLRGPATHLGASCDAPQRYKYEVGVKGKPDRGASARARIVPAEAGAGARGAFERDRARLRPRGVSERARRAARTCPANARASCCSGIPSPSRAFRRGRVRRGAGEPPTAGTRMSFCAGTQYNSGTPSRAL